MVPLMRSFETNSTLGSAFGCKVGAECLTYQANVTQSFSNEYSPNSGLSRWRRRANFLASISNATMGREPRWVVLHACQDADKSAP